MQLDFPTAVWLEGFQQRAFVEATKAIEKHIVIIIIRGCQKKASTKQRSKFPGLCFG
jgi:hypothetical protein